MKSCTFKSLLFSTILFAAFNAVNAQSDENSFDKKEKRARAFAEKIRAAALDAKPPKQITVEAWLKSIAGETAVVTWEINDCGDQTGEPGDGSNVNPRLCAELNARLANKKYVGIQIVVGTFKKGVDGKPEVAFIYVNTGDKSDYPKNLPELAAFLQVNH